MEELISHGHSYREVWTYTLKQIVGYLRIARKRVRLEKADLLALNTIAARGSEQVVKKNMRDLKR